MPDAIGLRIPWPEPASLARLIADDALGQLTARSGRMRELGAEGGDVKLDWMEGVELALANPERLAAVEREAAAILDAGIRHVIWAGMGGSVQTLYALWRLGYTSAGAARVHPLDCTDPASLNRLLATLAADEGMALPASGPIDATALRPLLEHTLMIGVSMGMTSEEPITHLEWFDALLKEAGVTDPSAHIQVMTLPDSYLDVFARQRGSSMTPIQLDAENHTPGRMSTPATRVFLRPVALRLVGDARTAGAKPAGDGRLLAGVLRRGQSLGGLPTSLDATARTDFARSDAFTRLGAYLSDRANEGRNKLWVRMPTGWEGFVPWLEQLVEESLGKGGKGLLIFYDQQSSVRSPFGADVIPLDVRIGNGPQSAEETPHRLRRQASTAVDTGGEVAPMSGSEALTLDVPLDRKASPGGLGELAALCLGFERMVAVFGYLQGIVFAGQPAVEAYKRYARELREAPADVAFTSPADRTASHGALTLLYDTPLKVGRVSDAALDAELSALGGSRADAVAVLAALLRIGRRDGWLRYLDLTFNGELTPDARSGFERARRGLANGALGIPCKLRTGPSDYHSTEQSETDGPAELFSLRFVALEHEPVRAGSYSDKFLLAQARGTWQAMEDAGRPVVMITMPALNPSAQAELDAFFAAVRQRI
jgi:glucose-6-phosphate isomerase